MDWIRTFFEWLGILIDIWWEGVKAMVSDFITWIGKPLYDVFLSVVHFFIDAFLTLVEWFVGLIDFKSDLFDMSLGWAQFPDQVIWILNQCGFDNGMLIIVTAITIRLLLNLIPTWATRV